MSVTINSKKLASLANIQLSLKWGKFTKYKYTLFYNTAIQFGGCYNFLTGKRNNLNKTVKGWCFFCFVSLHKLLENFIPTYLFSNIS